MLHNAETPAALLLCAQAERDPVRRFALLSQAEELAPDDLSVQRALLMHGRLHERDGRRMDYSVIKCYLFHVFEHPEQHNEKEQEAFARELLHGVRLQKCLALAEDAAAFLHEYLTELAGEYMRIFVLPDRSHAPWAFGLALGGRRGRHMARPAYDVLHNLLSCPFYTKEEQRLAAGAFYRAYFKAMDGDVQALHNLLGEELCRQLA
ncbi:MAG: hypothetical protein ACOX58_09185 [Christensenellales bacterium]|jgi:hypothetical protein